MQVRVDSAQLQTLLFSAIFLAALLVSIKKVAPGHILTVSKTEELKGFAILSVVFGHIGYFLSLDSNFLYPLSIDSGLGVNLFLFLSGFGLALSSVKQPLSPTLFYKKRLIKLFLPLWITLLFLLFLQFLYFNKTYPVGLIIKNFFGFFPNADIYTSLNSALWYFTLILFYYLAFPWLFVKKHMGFCAGAVFLLSLALINLPLPVDQTVVNLYKLHILAFPLGVLFAHFSLKKPWENMAGKIAGFALRPFFLMFFAVVFAYFSLNSGVGRGAFLEQGISITAMLALVVIFLFKAVRFKLLGLFGKYSYEIYLIHWPLIYRYDFLFKFMPPFLATIIYLGIFIFLGTLMQRLVKLIYKLPKPGR